MKVLFALVEKGTHCPASFVHQDDEETPIESDNLEVLISMISD
jgi:hypothetical protein